MSCELLVITGPTASGKTRRAVDVARATGGEILSADSRQVYTGMDIGTGKDMDEYGSVPVHLLDIAPAGYRYNLFEYLRDFRVALRGVRSRGSLPIVCGGTGLYVESILRGVALPPVPENAELRRRLATEPLESLAATLASMKRLHNTTDIDTPQRAIRAIEIETYYQAHPEAAQAARNPEPVRNAVIVGVDIDRDTRRSRIDRRLDQRLDQGMVQEVRSLLDSGIKPEDLAYYGLEYKFVTLHVTGQLTLDQMRSQLATAIHQFAKRQMTWFRGMERRGFKIHWLPCDMPAQEFTSRVLQLMRQA